jgi:hypothetical protein
MRLSKASTLIQLSVFAGYLALPASGFSASLQKDLNYPISGMNQPLPATFASDMSKGLKVEPYKHGCTWASRPNIYIFDDGVLYVDGGNKNFNAFPIDTVAKQGCSLPGSSGFVGVPAIRPVPLDQQAVMDGTKSYATVSLLDKRYDLSGTPTARPVNFVAEANSGVQLTQRQISCSLARGPFIYAFVDGVIFTTRDGSDYQGFTNEAAIAAGCKLPFIQKQFKLIDIPTTNPSPTKLALLKTLAPSFDFELLETANGNNMAIYDLIKNGQELKVETLGCSISKAPYAFRFDEGVIFTSFKSSEEDFSYEFYFNSTLDSKKCNLTGTSTPTAPTTPTADLALLTEAAKSLEIEVKTITDGNSMDVYTLAEKGKKIDPKTLGCSVSKKPYAFLFRDGVLFTNYAVATDDDFFYDLALSDALKAAKCTTGLEAATPAPTPIPSDANNLTCESVSVAKRGLIGRYIKGSFDENAGIVTNRAVASVVDFTSNDDANKRGLDFFSIRSDALSQNLTLAPEENFTVNLATDKKLVLGNFDQFVEVKRKGAGYTVERYAYINSFRPNEKPSITLINTTELSPFMGYAFNPWVDTNTYERFLKTGFGIAVTKSGLLTVKLVYPRAKKFRLGDYYSDSDNVTNIRAIAATSCRERFFIHSFMNDPEPYCIQGTDVGGWIETLSPLPISPGTTDLQYSQEQCKVANASKPTELVGDYVTRPLGSEFLTLIEKDNDYTEVANYRQFFITKTKVGADYLAVANTAAKYLTAQKLTLEFGFMFQTPNFVVGEAYMIGYLENGKLANLSIFESKAGKKVQEKRYYLQMDGVFELTQDSDVTADYYETDVNQMLRHSFWDNGDAVTYDVQLFKNR